MFIIAIKIASMIFGGILLNEQVFGACLDNGYIITCRHLIDTAWYTLIILYRAVATKGKTYLSVFQQVISICMLPNFVLDSKGVETSWLHGCNINLVELHESRSVMACHQICTCANSGYQVFLAQAKEKSLLCLL